MEERTQMNTHKSYDIAILYTKFATPKFNNINAKKKTNNKYSGNSKEENLKQRNMYLSHVCRVHKEIP